MRASRFCTALLTLALSAGIVLPILPLAAGLWITNTDELTGVAWMTAAFAVAGYLCSLAYERGKLRLWMLTGLVTGALACVIWAWTIITQPRTSDLIALSWVATPLSGWTLLMTFCGVLALLRVRQAWVERVRHATSVLAALLVAIGVFAICVPPSLPRGVTWKQRNTIEDVTSRLAGVLGILTGCGMIVVLTAAYAPQLRREETPESERLAFAVTCPRCAARQTITTEGDACAACGLRIKVTPT
jgi:hypothetical protein